MRPEFRVIRGLTAAENPSVATAQGSVDLYWIPLGGDGPWVRFGSGLYEAVIALVQRRARHTLYHAVLEVAVEAGRYVIELAPVWNRPVRDVGAVAEGPVGTRWLGRSRMFRYEIRAWRNGLIPDLDRAVESPRRLSHDPAQAARVLSLLPEAPLLTWGRDEIGCGEMWNSNSLASWLLARSGHDLATVGPPAGGRAPGWRAGVFLAGRDRLEVAR